jgi:hypothetical protein
MADFGDHMKALADASPFVHIKRKGTISAEIRNKGTSAFVSAVLNGDGSVSIQHITSMSAEKFARIMAILNEKGG